MKIRLDQIAGIDECNVRKRVDPTKVSEMKESIIAKGIFEDLIVRPAKGKDRYKVLAGQMKYYGAKAAKFNEIEVKVRDIPDQEALELSLISNIMKTDLDVVDRAEGINKILAGYKSLRQMSKGVGIPYQTLHSWISILKLPEDILSKIESVHSVDSSRHLGKKRSDVGSEKKISFTTGKAIAQVADSDDDARSIFDDIAGLPTHEAVSVIKGMERMTKTERTKAMLQAPRFIKKDVWDKKTDYQYRKDIRFVVKLAGKEMRILDDWSYKHGFQADEGPIEILRRFGNEWAKKIGKTSQLK